MKPQATRVLVAFGASVLAWLLVLGASRPSEPVLQPDKLVILSTTDVKGKTSPCGCHTPKGGLARRASFVDSTKLQYGQVVLVDNGGFFPEGDTHPDVASFMMDAMKMLGTDAVGLGDRDLRFGIAFLRDRVQGTGVPVVSANLLDPMTKKPILQPYVIRRIGNLNVGIFSLMSPKGDLGPAKDSLLVADPATTARKIEAELRRKGATTILLLSQLGKVESEDLVAAVTGIDAVMVGRNVGMLQKGRTVKNTVACYGGDQGHYVCRTTLTLDAKRRPTAGVSEAIMLGPEIPNKPEVLAAVKSFEDALNEKYRKLEEERAAREGRTAAESRAGR